MPCPALTRDGMAVWHAWSLPEHGLAREITHEEATKQQEKCKKPNQQTNKQITKNKKQKKITKLFGFIFFIFDILPNLVIAEKHRPPVLLWIWA